VVCWFSRPLPRHIAKKAEAYLISSGVAERAYFGPEAEFYILDSVRFDQSYNYGYYHIDSEEGFWNSGEEGENGSKNLGHHLLAMDRMPRHWKIPLPAACEVAVGSADLFSKSAVCPWATTNSPSF
jgi:glutamine synthetase